MRRLYSSFSTRVASGRLASSAQPPRATSPAAHRRLSRPTPQPFRSIFFRDPSGALLEGLRCFPAFRPLPNPRSDGRKNHRMLVPQRNQE
jgi:hypothetical protein